MGKVEIYESLKPDVVFHIIIDLSVGSIIT